MTVDWVRVGSIATAVASFVAMGALAVQGGQLKRDADNKQVLEWQEVTVYSIIDKTGARGASFADIQRDYKNEAADLPAEMPRTEIQTQALKRALLQLMSKRAIGRLRSGSYAVTYDGSSVL